jgi:hypothetical protein
MNFPRLYYAYSQAFTATPAVCPRVSPLTTVAVRISCTQDCWISIGISPAVTSGGSGGAGVGATLIRASTAGEGFMILNGEQIAVVSNGTNGVLSVTEVN